MKRAKVFFVAVSSVLLLASSAVAAPEGGRMKEAKAKAEEARARNKTSSFASAKGIEPTAITPTATGGRLRERYTVNSASFIDQEFEAGYESRATVVTLINRSRNPEDAEVVFYDRDGFEVCKATPWPGMPPGVRVAVTTGWATYPVINQDDPYLFYAVDPDGFPCPPFEGYAAVNTTNPRMQIDAFMTYYSYAEWVPGAPSETISATPVRVQRKKTPTKGD